MSRRPAATVIALLGVALAAALYLADGPSAPLDAPAPLRPPTWGDVYPPGVQPFRPTYARGAVDAGLASLDDVPTISPDALSAAVAAINTDLVKRDLPLPEYARTLEEIFLAEDPSMNFDRSMAPVVAALPDYARVIYISPRAAVQPALAERTTLLLEDSFPKDPRHRIEGAWIRDPFVVLTRLSGTSTLLLANREHFAERADEALRALGFKVKPSTLNWSGGNLRFDIFDGRHVLFVGFPEQGKQNPQPAAELARLFAETFTADRVVFMPYVPHLFHLDQIALPIAPGKVVVNQLDVSNLEQRVNAYLAVRGNHFQRSLAEHLSTPAQQVQVGSPAFEQVWRAAMEDTTRGGVRSFALRLAQGMHDGLEAVAAKFREEGYEVIPFPADVERLFDFETYMNSVVYRHKQTGRQTIILPAFGSRPSMQASNEEARQFFERLGFDVTTFNDILSFSAHGSVHCLTNYGRQSL